jgi:hypothetical protein
MPATRNLRVRRVHNASTGRPLLRCSFEGCERRFQSRNNLTRHQRTSHLSDAGPSHSNSSLPQDEPNGHHYHCTFAGCLRSFTSKGALTQHSRLQHSFRSVPETAPLSPLHSEPKTPQAPSTQSHSPHRTPLFFPEADDQMDIDQDFPYYGDDDFMPPGSDESFRDGMHLPSSSPGPARGNSTHPSSAEGNASDRVKRSYHPQINGMPIYLCIASYHNS